MRAPVKPSSKGRKGKAISEFPSEPVTDPVEAARAAGLVYVTDALPGIRRLPFRDKFRYTNPDATPLRDTKTLARIKSLVIPPAWTDVWIATSANGHLQATGRDVRGRKQSRYHPRWRATRDETKYERMTHFAAVLPTLRARIQHDLALPGLPLQRVLATIVSLMEATLIRVGNVEYARENKSYGLTTMRNRHVEVHGSEIVFSFQGKSRVHHTINLRDRRLAKIVKRCSDIPGQELFQYLDAEGKPHAVNSTDVNGYLQEITGQHFTAKDFRTWAGSVLAHDLLQAFEPFTSETQAKKNVVQAIATVAARLGNTPSVCRKCYVHPAVLDAYLGGKTVQAAEKELEEEIAEHAVALRREERMFLELLEQRVLLEGVKGQGLSHIR